MIFNDRMLFSYLFLGSVFIGSYTIAPLLAIKVAQIGPFTLPAGDFIYALTFLCTDITNEVFGKKYAKKIVICGLITLIIVNLFTQVAVHLPSAPFWEGAEAYNSFFESGFRIFLATVIAYIASQLADIYIFSYLRDKMTGRGLWLRNNVSTFVARFIDIVIFVTVAFYGVFDTPDLVQIIISGYIVGVLISLMDTPFVYLGVKLLQKNN